MRDVHYYIPQCCWGLRAVTAAQAVAPAETQASELFIAVKLKYREYNTGKENILNISIVLLQKKYVGLTSTVN